MEQLLHTSAFGHFFIAMLLIISMVLISRTIVAGTKYSSILVIVLIGLAMGAMLVKSGMATPGLAELPAITLISQTTVIALIASFFVGGQEIRRLLSKKDNAGEAHLVPSSNELVLGTTSTQLYYVIRSFFILMGIEMVHSLLSGKGLTNPLGQSYLLLGYISLIVAFIFIDNKAKFLNKQSYIRKGFIEVIAILLVMKISYMLAQWIEPSIKLPQIFFAMILASSLGGFLYNWKLGPTLNALLFAGIPVVLGGSFLVGGSRMLEAFTIDGMQSVMLYGFSGQLFWMFAGLAVMIFLAKANHLRNLAPGMAGGLSHSGLTGACTAGDLGDKAAARAPIMINVPFVGHIFVFTILAASAERGSILTEWTIPLILVGFAFLVFAIRNLRKSKGDEALEIKGLMQFSMGWQVVAVFGSFTLLNLAGMPLEHVSLAVSSALSHFGLFAAVQDGMFGSESAGLIAFIFAMPFLIHPLVFGLFGKAAEKDGSMSPKIVLLLASIGAVGMVVSLLSI
ncbi:hypothetical protein GCM10007916_02970 [Psychromonas marina]|uniref:Uncharacterized protein n=1 Tax=Psychromonas marina TaxID=88364 RepID=A0ABQ6DVV6_9GAMM|nr:hypothetical protein [Psychromonas marina]GLS89230.1 hypothetical protein GCM10007916_02970 [Psychromonas marina]